jgi:hypothetical protein
MSSADCVHELFPAGAGFRVALEGVLNREDDIPWDGEPELSEVQVSILVIDDDERQLVGGGEFAYALVALTFRLTNLCVCTGQRTGACRVV